MQAVLEAATLVVVGWVTGAEGGSWYCVQPVIPQLPYAQQVQIEQGMLRTFGRLMPVLMPLSAVLAVALTTVSAGGAAAFWLRVIAATCIGITIVTTLTINVPINSRTSTWDMSTDASEWHRVRAHWHRFQGLRACLFMAAFIMLAIAATIR
jgi:Domain of unknown function (DUF1772)